VSPAGAEAVPDLRPAVSVGVAQGEHAGLLGAQRDEEVPIRSDDEVAHAPELLPHHESAEALRELQACTRGIAVERQSARRESARQEERGACSHGAIGEAFHGFLRSRAAASTPNGRGARARSDSTPGAARAAPGDPRVRPHRRQRGPLPFPLAHRKARLPDLRERPLQGGVYSLLTGRKPPA